MQIVSESFKTAMGNRPFFAKLTLDGVDVIPDKAVQEIYFRGGTNSSEEQFVLGSAVSSSVEVTLDKMLVGYDLKGRELFVELGVELAASIEWLPMGTYTVESADADDGILTVVAQDALHAKFDVDYEPLDGFTFNTEAGVASTTFLEALCARRGVAVDLSGLESIPLKAPPDGFTERQIIGFISALYGGYANISRLGVLRICHYSETDAKVTADNYYEDGMEKATYGFTVGWLKCYNEITDLTMFVGDLNADQGIYMESIWMNQTTLNGIWEKLQAFSYRPVKGVSFLGNPLMDPGDIISLEDLSGEIVQVPVMAITHEYDGGLITTITASGQAKAASTDGPTKKAVFRSARRSAETAKEYTDAENKKLNQLELLKRLTKDWVDDGIYLTDEGKIAINASAILAGIIQASLIQTGVLQSKDGKTFVLDLDNNTLKAMFSELSISGKTVDQIAQEKADSAANAASQALNDYAATVTKELAELQAQIDGNITSWFGDYVPTTSNEPASNWTTDDLKNQHLGDLFYINEGAEQGGMVYRWALVNGSYQWVIVEDTDVAKALAAAAAAQDTADSKRRVFVAQPTPPYDVGDLWTQGSGGDLMRCKTSRASGSYSESDWELASKYIDAAKAETIAQGKVDNQTQEEIFNKLTNDGAVEGLYMKDGKIYINASYILTGILNASLLRTGVIQSADGKIALDLDSGKVTIKVSDTRWVVVDNLGITSYSGGLESSNITGRLWLTANGPSLTNGPTGNIASIAAGYGTTKVGMNGTSTEIAGQSVKITSPNNKVVVNPGKKLLWQGSWAVGGTATVSDTADYDLFAIRLGDSSGTFSETILAYKSGNRITGVGGWAGTSDEYKALHFVTFTFSGDSWTLEDCGYHYVYSQGGISSGTRVSVCEIEGVI